MNQTHLVGLVALMLLNQTHTGVKNHGWIKTKMKPLIQYPTDKYTPSDPIRLTPTTFFQKVARIFDVEFGITCDTEKKSSTIELFQLDDDDALVAVCPDYMVFISNNSCLAYLAAINHIQLEMIQLWKSLNLR